MKHKEELPPNDGSDKMRAEGGVSCGRSGREQEVSKKKKKNVRKF